MLLDHFILHFKDNSNLMLDVKEGDVVCCGKIMELTNNKAQYIGKSDKGMIMIAIPKGIFIEIKDNTLFHGLCATLRKIETSATSVLGMLCFPFYINKEIDENTLNQILQLKS